MTAPTRKTVELFYDVISPYTWVAFEFLCRARQVWNIDLKLRPILLGAVFKLSGNTAPPEIRSKAFQDYQQQDLYRTARYYGIPLRQPANKSQTLRKGSLQAMRFVTAVDHANPSLTEAISRELWLRNWSRDLDITQPESLEQAGADAGLSRDDVTKFVLNIQEPEVKNRLKDASQEAVNYGAFGSPSIVIHGKGGVQLIFGSDRFEIMADMLQEDYPGPLTHLAHPKASGGAAW